jgi:hypothetical protein
VITFDTLPSRNRVSGVTGTPCSTSARPKPSDQITTPSRATATDAPGTCLTRTSSWIWARACSSAAPSGVDAAGSG